MKLNINLVLLTKYHVKIKDSNAIEDAQSMIVNIPDDLDDINIDYTLNENATPNPGISPKFI